GTRQIASSPRFNTFSIDCKYTSVFPLPVTPCSKNVVSCSFWIDSWMRFTAICCSSVNVKLVVFSKSLSYGLRYTSTLSSVKYPLSNNGLILLRCIFNLSHNNFWSIGSGYSIKNAIICFCLFARLSNSSYAIFNDDLSIGIIIVLYCFVIFDVTTYTTCTSFSSISCFNIL